MATQDFSGTNGDALPTVDAKWQQVAGANTLVRTGGVCKPDAPAHSAFYCYSDSQPANQSSQADVGIIAPGDAVFIGVQMRTGGNLGYTITLSAGTNMEVRRDNVYQTDFTSPVNFGSSGATVKLRLGSDNLLIASVNGVDSVSTPLDTTTGGGRISGGFPGIGISEAAGGNASYVDNWTDGIGGGGSPPATPETLFVPLVRRVRRWLRR